MDTYLPTLTVAGVLGFLAPLLATAINKLTWSPQVKQLVAILVAAIMAVLALLITNSFAPPDPEQPRYVWWLLVLFQVIAISQMAYALIWKPTQVDAKLAVATARGNELAEFKRVNTLPGATTVDSTETDVAQKINEQNGVNQNNPARDTPGPDHRSDPGAVG